MNEPYVKVTESVVNAPSSAIQNSDYTVGAVIVSDFGPADPQLITSRSQLLSTYNNGASLSPSSDSTLVNAYRLVGSCPMVIQRALPLTQSTGSSVTYEFQAYCIQSDSGAVELESVLSSKESKTWAFYLKFKGLGLTTWKVKNADYVGLLDENGNAATGYMLKYTSDKTVDLDSPNGNYSTVIYSLIPGVTDEYGYSAYVEDRFSSNSTFEVVMGSNATGISTWEAKTSGDPGSNEIPESNYITPSTPVEAAPMIENGINVLAEQDIYPITMFCDLGFTVASTQNAYYTAGNSLWILSALSCVNVSGTDDSVMNSINQQLNNLTLGNQAIVQQTWEKTTGLTGFTTYIAPSVLYCETVANNASGNNEFAPVIGEQNGIANIGNPVKILSKSNRELLLDSQVNSCFYKRLNDSYYFNNNLTKSKVANVLQEDQNRRLANKINKDLKFLMGQFIGQLNTVKTRSNVENVIDQYFNENILNMKYSIDDYIRVCNETNNPDDVIRRNELHVYVGVRMNSSIKYITVLDEYFPMGVAFNE